MDYSEFNKARCLSMHPAVMFRGKLNAMKKLPVTKKQFWLIIAILFIIAFLIDLNSRIITLKALQQQKSILETDVAKLQITKVLVEEKIGYAESDAAVEAWARQQGMMMQEGDNVIIPIPVGNTTPTPTPIPTTQPVVYQNWEVWKALIFD
ncbi:MAG: hypothetical protein GX933_04125 [Chloroflexi bacterium]|nr:hypothetical protein [Chloroflexota bacterium]